MMQSSRALMLLGIACMPIGLVRSDELAPAHSLYVQPAGLRPAAVPGAQTMPAAQPSVMTPPGSPEAQMPVAPAAPVVSPSFMMPAGQPSMYTDPQFLLPSMEAVPVAEAPASPFVFLGSFAGGLAAGAALVYSLVKTTGQKVSAEVEQLELGALPRRAAVSMKAEGEIGAYDPLNLLAEPLAYPRRIEPVTMQFGKRAPAKAAGKRAPAKKAAPAKKGGQKFTRRASGGFSPETDIGVTAPLGFFDPLGFTKRGPEVYRRYQEIEIKHGRIAMFATLGVITTEAGVRLPGYISTANDLKFSDVPGSLDGAYFGIPIPGWIQIVCFIAALDIAVFRQDPANEPGDVVQDLAIDWVRYDDPEVRRFKLNVERNNGRAAMLGILGMISHSALGQDALFPLISKSGKLFFLD